MKSTILLLSALTCMTFTPVLADNMAMDHHDMKMPHSIYDNDMNTMHKAMMVKPTGNPDVDFVQAMIPHHEGAVAMAKTLLANGKDPELHRLAQDIIRAQESEIRFMKEWLAKHPPATPQK